MIAQEDTPQPRKPLPPVSPAPTGYQSFDGPMVNAGAPPPSPGGVSAAGSTTGPTGPSIPASGPSLPPVSPAPQSSAPPMSYGTTSQFAPGKDLLSTQIQPGAESNRFDLARQALDTYSKSELPAFRASVRNEVGNQAALGRTGSGMLNTSLGNLDLAEQDKYNTMAQQLLNSALGNQIGDNANQRAELRGERDYQTGRADTAFGQGVAQTQLGDQLTNSAFGRALQQLGAGDANNPSNTQLILSSIFGGQAGAANQALGGLIGNTVNRNAQSSGMDTDALLRAIFGGGGSLSGGNTPSTPGAGVNVGGLFGPKPLPGVQTIPNYGGVPSDSQTF